nr:uncharacterized protein LOC124808903 [Hydra vulgaris]
MDKNSLLNSLIKSYNNARPFKKKVDSQKKVHKIWNEIKEKKDLEDQVKTLIQKYTSMVLKQKGFLMSFWAYQTTKRSVPSHSSYSALEFQSDTNQIIEPIDIVDTTSDISRPDILSTVQIETKKAKTHAQDTIKSEIVVLNQETVAMKRRKRSGLWADAEEETFKKKKANVQELTTNLNKLIGNIKSKQKSRAEKKTVMNQVFAYHPEVKKALKVRDGIGRPTIEVKQSEILRVIIQLAEHGSAAHDKRQSEVYRSLKLLDELGAELEKRGYHLQKCFIYSFAAKTE